MNFVRAKSYGFGQNIRGLTKDIFKNFSIYNIIKNAFQIYKINANISEVKTMQFHLKIEDTVWHKFRSKYFNSTSKVIEKLVGEWIEGSTKFPYLTSDMIKKFQQKRTKNTIQVGIHIDDIVSKNFKHKCIDLNNIQRAIVIRMLIDYDLNIKKNIIRQNYKSGAIVYE